MRMFLSDRAKKCDDGRLSNESQQSHEGSFFGRKKKKKKRNLLGGDFFCFVCIYLRSVIEPC